MKILIVEDQENLAKLIKKGLLAEGYLADYVVDGKQALKQLHVYHQDYDLVILDYMLPNKDGIEILNELRKSKIQIPVLMLTAKAEKRDVGLGLDSGADDYLTKPFSFDELYARIRAILRRPKTVLPQEIEIGSIKLNTAAKHVSLDGKPIKLTLKEFNLLEYLFRHPDIAHSREDILANVWDFAFDSFANVVDVHVSSVRKKLGDTRGDIIQTVRGIGYKVSAR